MYRNAHNNGVTMTARATGAGGHSGFSTIEILIAFSVGIIFLSAAMMIAFSDPTRTTQYGIDNTHTISLDTILDNNALATSTSRFGNIIASLLLDWDMVATTATAGLFTHTPGVTDISPCVKQVTNVTSWESMNARGRAITLQGAVSNIEHARELGRGGCDPMPTEAWDNPIAPSGWETAPNDIGGTQTGLDVATINGTLYVFMITTHTSQKDDLWVVDVSDRTNPEMIRSLEVGGSGNTKGLIDIVVVSDVSETYAYVIQNNSTHQLKTIDVSDPRTLTISDITSTTSLDAYGVTSGGSDPIPTVITYYDGRLYIGLHNTTGPEFLVFDVTSDPEVPAFVGSLNLGHSINDIVVRGDYAYLAIKPGTGAGAQNTKELMVLDVSGSTPVNTGWGYNASSTANDTEGAATLYAIGSKLYMGRERVSNAAESDFYVFDISNPASPYRLKSKRLGISTGGSMGTPRVIDLIVQGKLGFFVTTDSSKSFQVYDVVSSTTNITTIDSGCSNFINLPRLVEIQYNNNLIYGANGNQAALNILYDNPSSCSI